MRLRSHRSAKLTVQRWLRALLSAAQYPASLSTVLKCGQSIGQRGIQASGNPICSLLEPFRGPEGFEEMSHCLCHLCRVTLQLEMDPVGSSPRQAAALPARKLVQGEVTLEAHLLAEPHAVTPVSATQSFPCSQKHCFKFGGNM